MQGQVLSPIPIVWNARDYFGPGPFSPGKWPGELWPPGTPMVPWTGSRGKSSWPLNRFTIKKDSQGLSFSKIYQYIERSSNFWRCAEINLNIGIPLQLCWILYQMIYKGEPAIFNKWKNSTKPQNYIHWRLDWEAAVWALFLDISGSLWIN